MTAATVVNSAGLLLDVLGAGLIWRFGLSAEISRSGAIHIIAQGADEAEKRKASWYDRVSFWGFFALVVGFLLQLFSNFMR